MTTLAAIAISGGIDSLVSAHLLRQAGHPLLPLHFVTGFEPWCPADANPMAFEDLHGLALKRMAPVASQLGVAIEIVDLRTAFRRCVVDDFTAAYSGGRTPNPCLVCNPGIKFGHLWAHARRRGAAFLATGHYAQISHGDEGRPELRRGVDPAKDQSYFLARLSADQLSHTRFPLGAMTKADTRAIAADVGLRSIAEQESQDICFIPQGDYGEFLTQQTDFRPEPGPIVDMAGQRLGSHQGLHRFTIGQRRGIGIPAPEPYYVIRLEPQAHRLVVGPESALYRRTCRVTEINWIATPPDNTLNLAVQIRYRHRATPATLVPLAETEAEIRFSDPQKAITPGQGAVFYQADRVLGGGWISARHAAKGGPHACGHK